MFKKENFKLIAVISIMVIVGVGGYYLLNLKQGKYPVSSFISVSYAWGTGDTLANQYHSQTGAYQYLDYRDHVVKKNVKLRANNIIFLHNKANELDLWQLPNVIANEGADLKSTKVLRYEIVFNYQEKTKKIIYLTDYRGDPAIAAKADQLQAVLKQMLDEVEERYGK